jgi:hypothetical protein
MALTHQTATRNAMADACVDLIDGGTGAGNLVIMTSGAVEVATLVCSATAFGAAASGTATAAAISDDTSATGGTAALFKFEDGDNTEIFRGSVGTSGADLNLSSVAIGAGDTVSITSFTYSASA